MGRREWEYNFHRIVMDLINILWLFIILASLQPAIQRRLLDLSRQRALSRLASERGSTVVTLIHRQETMSFLGFPLVRYINIDDAEGVLSAIRSTPAARAPGVRGVRALTIPPTGMVWQLAPPGDPVVG